MDKQTILKELDQLKELLHETRAYVINNKFVEAKAVVGLEMEEQIDDIYQILHEILEQKNPTP